MSERRTVFDVKNLFAIQKICSVDRIQHQN